MSRRVILYQLGIVLIAALLFIPFIGNLHLFDWDEINFAESAREMILTKDYLTVKIFFKPFWEKPPLFIWMQVLSMKIFGINEFAARFPNSVCGIATLLVLFNIGRSLYNNRFGLIWVMAYVCSVLPFFYFKSGIIDPWFNLFIFLGVFFWIKAYGATTTKNEITFLLLSAASLGLAVLTKGPVAILIFGLLVIVLFISGRFRIPLKWYSLGLFMLTLIFVGGFWFLLQIIDGHFDIVKEFIVYQYRLFRTKDAGHGGFLGYHFVVLLLGVFPASVFAIQGHKYNGERDFKRLFHSAMVILFWVVLLLFTVVKTKIIHYSSLCYFPMTYLAAYSLYKIFEGNWKFAIWQKLLLGVIGFSISIAVILLPFFIKHKDYFIEKKWITHSFTIGNLQAHTGWTWSHSLIGVALLLGLIYSLSGLARNPKTGILILFASSLLFINGIILFLTPGAEMISQNAAIEFFQKAAKKNVYVYSFYKSYARLFYTNQQVPKDTLTLNADWLLKGNIDKDVYSVLRIDKKDEILKRYPDQEVMYEKNGYVFSVRHPHPVPIEKNDK